MTERESAPCWLLCVVPPNLGPSPIVTVHRESAEHAMLLVGKMLEAPGVILENPFLVVELPPGECWCHKVQPTQMETMKVWRVDLSATGVGKPGDRTVVVMAEPVALKFEETDSDLLEQHSLVRATGYVSSCCRGPVDVYQGKIQNPDGTPYSGGKDWRILIIRRCAVCGQECEGVK